MIEWGKEKAIKFTPTMQTLKQLNIAAAFFVEIAMLISLAIAGYQISDTKWSQYGLAVILPLLAIILWAVWAAPKSTRRLSRPWLTLFKLVLFLVTAILLFGSGHILAAFVFGVVACSNELLAVYWKN